MSLPKFKGIPKGIAWLSMVGLLSLMFAAPAVATDGQPPPANKVLVCKVVGGPGHYSLKEGKQPIEVDANALEADVQPIVGAPFSDAQPSFVVASDDRTLCEAGLPPIVVPNPNPAGSVTFVQPSCTVDHVVANITDATPPGVGPGYAGIWYYLVSSRGAESQTPDSVDRLSSFALNSQPMAFGETVTFTVKAQLDTPEGSPQLVTIDSFTATRKNCEIQPPSDTKVTPTAPTSVDKCGTKDDTYTVPSKDGVVYKIDGAIKAAGTYQATGTVTVTAHPANETVVLEGKTSWTFEFTNVPCQPDPVIAPKASLSSECEILDGEKSGLTVVNAVLDNRLSSEEVVFEVAETIDGVTVFYPIPVAAGEEITPQVFYSAEDGKTVSLGINARDVALASLSFSTAGCAATVTPPPPPPTKVCPVGTKWVDVNHNSAVDKGECKTPVMHSPPVKPAQVAGVSANSVPPADTGWETHQGQGDTTSPWLMLFTGLGGLVLLTVAATKLRRQGAYRD